MTEKIRDKDQMVSRREAADILSVSTRTVQRYEQQGKLKGHKLSPRATRYYLTDVQALCV